MAAKNATPFVYELEIDGETVSLTFKPFDQVPIGIIRKHRKNTEEGGWALLEWGLSEDDLAALDDAPLSTLETVFDAWQESSKITAGESSSSST
jgi:hypothetical protein